MSTEASVLIRDIYPSICENLLEIRGQIEQQVLEEAKKSQDVSSTYFEASTKAHQIVSNGFSRFEQEAHRLYQSSPWSEIANMFLTTSKSQFFFCTLGLRGQVEKIITGKSTEESKETNDWVW